MTVAEASERERVLILDDDVLVGKVILAHVTAIGHDGRFTADPEEFLEWQRTWHPTRVIVDLVMELMDGIEVLNRLARDGSRAAVIISSGMGNRVMDAARRLADADGLVIAGLLSKPYKRADLSALLARSPSEASAHLFPHLDSGPWWTPAEFDTIFRTAVERGDIRAAYQPKVSCVDGTVVGYEALARWTHPDHGVIPPATFVPIAEREGLASLLTDTVLRSSLMWFASLGDTRGQRISVNVSATELSEPALDSRLLAACEDIGVAPDRVILEVTETSAMEDPVVSLQLLTRLRLKGFKVSLDDFGTGYSSMLQLARLPFSELKVDRSFVMSAARSNESRIVVRSIVDLGHALGMECTAEGVEDAEVLDLLDELGCDFAQGYYIARPMFPEALDRWMDSRAATVAH
jgi:EAL domain-containing protein (putative c-di-GMP-specific phosphodiesterase class I)/ActR/RegA family two-component response regulator